MEGVESQSMDGGRRVGSLETGWWQPQPGGFHADALPDFEVYTRVLMNILHIKIILYKLQNPWESSHERQNIGYDIAWI